MARGASYMANQVEQAVSYFFRRGNLIALRELALRQVAEQVDRSLENYMAAKDIQKNWGVRERIAVGASSNASARDLIAPAARKAAGQDSELIVVHVDTGRAH